MRWLRRRRLRRDAVVVLVRARALISLPAGWTQKAFARNHAGDPVEYWDREAVCFCVQGAKQRAAAELDVAGSAATVAGEMLYDAAFDLFGSYSLVTVNDQLGHGAVIETLDLAISRG